MTLASIGADGALIIADRDAGPSGNASLKATDWVRMDFAVPANFNETTATVSALLTLIDGQQLTGRIASDLTVEEAVVWDHQRLGRLIVPLDQVASVNPGEAAPDPTRPPIAPLVVQDTLWLANGDTLEGFLASCSDSTVAFIPSGATEAINVPMSGIQQAALANPINTTAAAWTLHLRDGSVLHAASLTGSAVGWNATLSLANIDRSTVNPSSVDPSGVDGTNASAGSTFSANEVIAIEQRLGGHRLVDLSLMPAEITDGGSILGWPAPPRWIAGRWCLQAPIALTWALPPQTRAVRFDVAVDPQAGGPDEPTPQTNCTVALLIGSAQAVAPRPLNKDHPQVIIDHSNSFRQIDAVGLDYRASLVLDDGSDGPVQDRLCLTRAWAVERVMSGNDE